MGAAQGKRVAKLLYGAHPEGMALVEDSDGALAIVLSRSGIYGITRFGAEARDAVHRFQQGVAATDGWHAILVSTPPSGQRDDPVYGLFECVLSSPPPEMGTAVGRRSGPRRPPRKR